MLAKLKNCTTFGTFWEIQLWLQHARRTLHTIVSPYVNPRLRTTLISHVQSVPNVARRTIVSTKQAIQMVTPWQRPGPIFSLLGLVPSGNQRYKKNKKVFKISLSVCVYILRRTINKSRLIHNINEPSASLSHLQPTCLYSGLVKHAKTLLVIVVSSVIASKN